MNFPGDDRAPGNPRSWTDWPVLISLVIDLILAWLYLRPAAASHAKGLLFMAILTLMWCGPALGLLLRRGRGAALLCYAAAKLAFALPLIGWWWASANADRPIDVPWQALWIAWHSLGIVLSLSALTRRNPPTSRA